MLIEKPTLRKIWRRFLMLSWCGWDMERHFLLLNVSRRSMWSHMISTSTVKGFVTFGWVGGNLRGKYNNHYWLQKKKNICNYFLRVQQFTQSMKMPWNWNVLKFSIIKNYFVKKFLYYFVKKKKKTVTEMQTISIAFVCSNDHSN